MTIPLAPRYGFVTPEVHRLVLGEGSPRTASFATPLDKARWLDASASLDSTSAEQRMRALRLTAHVPTREGKATAIHRWVRDAIAYQHDPAGLEEFADAETVARSGYDDCDGKARLFVSLIRALRDPELGARIRPVFDRAGNFVHVQAEVRWPGSERDPRRETPDGWILAELIVKGVELGEDPLRVARVAGEIPLAGPRRR